MEFDKTEWIVFSDMLEREMRDPEFRKLYEGYDEEDVRIRAIHDKRIAAKRAREESAMTSPDASVMQGI